MRRIKVAEQDIINARKEHLKWLKENAVELYPLVSGKSIIPTTQKKPAIVGF